MAIKIQGTTVVDDSRQLTNIQSIDAPSVTALQSAGLGAQETTLTRTFFNGEKYGFTFSNNIIPVVSVNKEIEAAGNDKTNNEWDVIANSQNYEFHDTSYDSSILPFSEYIDTFSVVKRLIINKNLETPGPVSFNNDGTKMYLTDISGKDIVNEYALSTAFDVSTAVYNNVTLDVQTVNPVPRGVIFNSDGTKMFLFGGFPDAIHQYSLSTAFDLSSASYDNVELDVGDVDFIANDFTFSPDGTKMYFIGSGNDSVYQYSLSTAFDLSSASYDNIAFSVTNEETFAQSVALNNNGTKMYITGDASDSVHQYTLSTAFDLSSASYDSVSFDVSTQDTTPEGISFNSDGTKMYIAGRGIFQASPAVRQYTLSTAFDISTASYDSILFDPSTQDTALFSGPKHALVNTDGTKLFVLGVDPDAVYQYTLSTAFDLSSASYDSVSFDVSTQDTNPEGLSFNSDGTKMYVIGNTTDSIYQYTLSTAFDLSSASYDTVSFDVSTQDTDPTSLIFNLDGTKMYIVVDGSNSVYQYTLSTAFDISTASYDNVEISVSDNTDFFPHGIAFYPNGEKLFVANDDRIYQYSLTTPFDLSTTSYDDKSFDVGPRFFNISINNNGNVLYASSSRDGIIIQIAISDIIRKIELDNGFSFSQTDVGKRIVGNGGDVILTDVDGSYVAKSDFNDNSTLTSNEWQLVGLEPVSEESGFTIANASVNGNLVYSDQYTTAITKSATNTIHWTDINSLIPDDSLGNGEIYYSISNDNRNSWSVINNENGTRKIVRNNSGVWEINDDSNYGSETWIAAEINDEFYALQEAVDIDTASVTFPIINYDNISFDNLARSIQGLAFKLDGTKMYGMSGGDLTIYEYDLSTPFDLKNVSINQTRDLFNITGNDFYNGIDITNDGTKIYVIGGKNHIIYQFTLSTPFDISTLSYNNISFDISAQSTSSEGVRLSPDGTKLFVSNNGDFDAADNKVIFQYTLSTPFDISTASYDNISLITEDSRPNDLSFTSDGTKMYVAGDGANTINEYALTTPFDISTASFVSGTNTTGIEDAPEAIYVNPDDTKIFISGLFEGSSVFQFSTELNTSQNRMTSASMQSISDENQITLGNTLDLAITMRLPNGFSIAPTAPTSDGVSIDYDANVLYEAAILGTDYKYTFSGNSLLLKSLADQNLKVKIL